MPKDDHAALQAMLARCPDCRGYVTTSANSFYVCPRHWQMIMDEARRKDELERKR